MTTSFGDLSCVAFAEIEGLGSTSTSPFAPLATAFDLDNFFLAYSRSLVTTPDGETDPHFHEFFLTLDLADADGFGGLLAASAAGEVFDELVLTTMFTGFGSDALLQQEVTLQNVTFYSIGQSLGTEPRIGVDFDGIEIVNFDLEHAFNNPGRSAEVLETFSLDLTERFQVPPDVFSRDFVNFRSLGDSGATAAFLNIVGVEGASNARGHEGEFEVVDFSLANLADRDGRAVFDSIYITVDTGTTSMSQLYQSYFSGDNLTAPLKLAVQFPNANDFQITKNALDITLTGPIRLEDLRENSDGTATLRLLSTDMEIVTRELDENGAVLENGRQTFELGLNAFSNLLPFDEDSYVEGAPDQLDATFAVPAQGDVGDQSFTVLDFDLLMPSGRTRDDASEQRLLIDLDPSNSDLNAFYQAWVDGTVLNDATFTLNRDIAVRNPDSSAIAIVENGATEQQITFGQVRVVSIAESSGSATQIELAYNQFNSVWTQSGENNAVEATEVTIGGENTAPDVLIDGNLLPVFGAQADLDLDSAGARRVLLDGPAAVVTDGVFTNEGNSELANLLSRPALEINGYELLYLLDPESAGASPAFSTVQLDLAFGSVTQIKLLELALKGTLQTEALRLIEITQDLQVSRVIEVQDWFVTEVSERGGFGSRAQIAFGEIEISEFVPDPSDLTNERTLSSVFQVEAEDENGVLSTFDLSSRLDTPQGLDLEMHARIGDITGNSIDPDFEGQFDILSYAFGVEHAEIRTQTTAGSVPEGSFLTLDIAPGQSGLTGLMAALSDGEVFDNFVLTVSINNDGSDTDLTRTIDLSDAVILEIEESTGAASRVLIGYDGIRLSQTDGTRTENVQASFDGRTVTTVSATRDENGVAEHTPAFEVSSAPTDIEFEQNMFLFLEGVEGDSVVFNQEGTFDVVALDFDLEAFQNVATEGNLGLDFAPITVHVQGTSVGLFDLLETTGEGQQISLGEIRLARQLGDGGLVVYQTITLNNVVLLGYQSEGLDSIALELGYGQIRIETEDFNETGASQTSPYVLDMRTDDNIVGTEGNDTLDGGAGDDTLLSGDGDDSVTGGIGNDVLIGGSGLGDDTYVGGGGFDTLTYPSTSLGIDVFLGNPGFSGTATGPEIGTDTIIDIDNLVLGVGDDQAVGNDNANRIGGLDGDDLIVGQAGEDTLLGEFGDDTLEGGDGNDSLEGGEGNDLLEGGFGSDILNGGLGEDILDGGDGTDLLSGGEGDDTLRGSFDADTLHGDAGDDVLHGDNGDDGLFGQDGQDVLLGGFGNDILQGGLGDDRLEGGDGDDSLDGGEGDDTLLGGAGDDEILVTGGNNAIEGGIGADLVTAGAGDDFIEAGFSDFGDAEDTVFAGGGDDTLIGGFFIDDLNGEAGDDLFLLRENDFGDNTDGGTGFDTLDISATTVGVGMEIDLANQVYFYTSSPENPFSIINVENVVGSDFADILVGDLQQNHLQGGSGDDQLTGSFGDTLEGGDGNDVATLGFATSEISVVVDDAGFFQIQTNNETVFLGQDIETYQFSDQTLTATGLEALIQLPPNGDVSVLGTARQGETLTAETAGLSDPNGIDSDLSIAWQRDGVATGDTGETYVLTQLDVGAEISALVTFLDGLGNIESVSSANLGPIENVNDAPQGTVQITGDARQDETLRVNISGLSDPDGTQTSTFSFQWQRDGADITGETGTAYALGQQDVGAEIGLLTTYVDDQGTTETVVSPTTSAVSNVNDAPQGQVLVTGTALQGETLTAETSGISDLDGLGTFRFQWQRDGAGISGATDGTYTLTQADAGSQIRVVVTYTDGQGTQERLTSTATDSVRPSDLNLIGTANADVLTGDTGNDTIQGLEGNDRLIGGDGNDSLMGDDGVDTLVGGAGNDTLIGGTSSQDLRDAIFAGDGNDSIDGGFGNDELRGDAGNDVIAGGFGADTVIGGAGDDTVTGSAFADLMFGGDGDDFVNGGFGHDLLNGGGEADRFFHIGVADHGSDWVQDYDATEGDVLQFGIATATADQFQVNFTHTATAAGERSGDDAIEEAFVIHRPTDQIMWALVDGGGQSSINLRIGQDVFDLLA
ncbi:hypothetical protein CSC82_12745 [Rhodobacteraceae bacterium 4F10]|nr:hypothetical protein CSC82_12745 [Rhodobacteraceae bacterium 4F10]